MKILILGASGMIGHALTKYFALCPEYQVIATLRDTSKMPLLSGLISKVQFLHDIHWTPENITFLASKNHLLKFDAYHPTMRSCASVIRSIVDVQPDVVINASGIIKHNSQGENASQVIALNTLLPHVLSRLTAQIGARLVQLSTDCVFSGSKGQYTESDVADAQELYGRSKFLGEIHHQKHVLTLRTSFIGHELSSSQNLLEWFLSQTDEAQGYRKAIYSGLATVELARIIHEHVLPNADLNGLYHLSGESINKYDLICQIAECYGKKISIKATDEPIIDRSLDATKFRLKTGFIPTAWPEMIRAMHVFG
jgi:dTDP-4-dehydrorhamnose reductase